MFDSAFEISDIPSSEWLLRCALSASETTPRLAKVALLKRVNKLFGQIPFLYAFVESENVERADILVASLIEEIGLASWTNRDLEKRFAKSAPRRRTGGPRGNRCDISSFVNRFSVWHE